MSARTLFIVLVALVLSACTYQEYPGYAPAQNANSSVDAADATSETTDSAIGSQAYFEERSAALSGGSALEQNGVDLTPELDATIQDVVDDTGVAETTEPDVVEETAEPDVVEETAEPDVVEDTVVMEGCDIRGLSDQGVTGTEVAALWTSASWGNGLWYVYLTEDPVVTDAERLSLEFYFDGTWSPSGPAVNDAHVFEIPGEDYSVCSTCILTGINCRSGLSDKRVCEREFLAQSGTLTISETGESGDTFSGELTQLRLIEVDIDRVGGSFVATPKEGGETWCVEKHSFALTIEEL